MGEQGTETQGAGGRNMGEQEVGAVGGDRNMKEQKAGDLGV